MAKVAIKSEKLSPFGGIFSIMEQYCGLRLAFGIFLLSLFRRFEGSKSTFTLELATVNAQIISDVSGLTKQYDYPNN